VSGRERARGRSGAAFIAWTPTPGRAVDIAAALGGEARSFYWRGIVDRRLIPLRYLVDAFRTAWYLGRRRPQAVIATNPPLFPALIAYAYSKVARIPFLLDSHTASFGLAGDELSRRMLPVHSWLAPRAAATIVTGDELGAVARSWGARPAIVHEPPPAWEVGPAGPLGPRPRVLFAGMMAGDEPLEEVIEAARLVPELDVRVTGDLRKRPPGLMEGAPPNVEFVGLLPTPEFAKAVGGADVILSLSTERVSVMRTAYEAVYAARPLVIPDRPMLRELFPYAVHVDLSPGGIAAGLRSAAARHDELVRAAPEARALQERRWRDQLALLRSYVNGDAPGPLSGA
jgi:hypothetical protein